MRARVLGPKVLPRVVPGNQNITNLRGLGVNLAGALSGEQRRPPYVFRPISWPVSAADGRATAGLAATSTH